MNRRTREKFRKYGLLGIGLFFLGSGTAYLLAGRFTYKNYWGGVVFVPFVILIGAVALFAFYRGLKHKGRH